MTHHTLHLGDCLEVMRTMPDCSVDAVVTDPPYGLSFMGKAWDYDVPGVDVWREVLRVLKPGGHLLAFAGTRTQHRMAVAIEDAGFEIRDMIAWVYGSGFPKSLDVSKAIDKCNGQPDRLHKFTAWMRTTELTARQLDKITDTNMGGHYLTAASQPAIPTAALWELIRPHCGDVPAWVDELVQRIEAEREVVGQKTAGIANPGDRDRHTIGGSAAVVVDITAPATPEAQQWAGWGTALKPALEPITMARKPFKGAVAANVLEHGTGAINVDGCRVGTAESLGRPLSSRPEASSVNAYNWSTRPNPLAGKFLDNTRELGRWPANLIHDGSDEVVGLFPEAQGMQRTTLRRGASTGTSIGGQGRYGTAGPQSVEAGFGDSGSAARFFKQCKGYAEAWPNVTPDPASTAGSCSSQQRQLVASALSDAATWALQGASCSSVSLAPSTSATGSELRQLCESVITAIQSIGPRFWHESEPARLSLKLSHASFAVHREPTGITTITASHWTSGGSADPVTFNIIGISTAAGDQASVLRAFYTAKATRAERQGVTHPTVKPLDLMAYLCRLVTPPGGVVLDPFMGSGTTIKAALSEGFNAIGIERDPAYFAMAEHRMNGAQLGLPLEAFK